MSAPAKRSTIYLDPELHRALRLKALNTGRSMTDLVNEAIRMAFREDQDDLSAFDVRVKEPEMTYEALLKDLKAHGKI
jgi:plasmid stability protein